MSIIYCNVTEELCYWLEMSYSEVCDFGDRRILEV